MGKTNSLQKVSKTWRQFNVEMVAAATRCLVANARTRQRVFPIGNLNRRSSKHWKGLLNFLCFIFPSGCIYSYRGKHPLSVFLMMIKFRITVQLGSGSWEVTVPKTIQLQVYFHHVQYLHLETEICWSDNSFTRRGQMCLPDHCSRGSISNTALPKFSPFSIPKNPLTALSMPFVVSMDTLKVPSAIHFCSFSRCSFVYFGPIFESKTRNPCIFILFDMIFARLRIGYASCGCKLYCEIMPETTVFFVSKHANHVLWVSYLSCRTDSEHLALLPNAHHPHSHSRCRFPEVPISPMLHPVSPSCN